MKNADTSSAPPKSARTRGSDRQGYLKSFGHCLQIGSYGTGKTHADVNAPRAALVEEDRSAGAARGPALPAWIPVRAGPLAQGQPTLQRVHHDQPGQSA